LLLAATHDVSATTVAHLLNAGCDKEATNRRLETALYIAASRKRDACETDEQHLASVQQLVAAGCNSRAECRTGLTPMDINPEAFVSDAATAVAQRKRPRQT
jgi:hypothetical protein